MLPSVAVPFAVPLHVAYPHLFSLHYSAIFLYPLKIIVAIHFNQLKGTMRKSKLSLASFLLCLFFFSFANQANAQQKLKGYVLDENTLKPIEGANVKSSINNVITDRFGKFLVTIAPTDRSVDISYVGYALQKVSFSNVQDSLLIYLKSTSNTMDEIVVVGYGTTKKSDIETKFLDTSLSVDEINEMSLKLQEINKKIDEKEGRWFELSSKME